MRTFRDATFRKLVAAGLVMAALAGCSETQLVMHTAKRVGRTTEAPPATGIYKVGTPYQIAGVWYYPAEDFSYDETGIASWYGPGFHGKQTANGEVYDMNEMTAAHRTLPMPSIVRVVNLDNGRSIVLKVNDRGPFAHGRIIDVSRRAAQLLGFEARGTARVRVSILADESRAIAGQMQGGRVIAANESPLMVEKVPAPNVDTTSLPPPPGASSAPPTQVASLPAPVEPPPGAGFSAPQDAVGQVSFGAPTPGQIYVQAGAFAQYDNANRVLARLDGVGNARISSILVNGRDLFRVRIGPIASVEEADAALERVISSGYPDARVIVD